MQRVIVLFYVFFVVMFCNTEITYAVMIGNFYASPDTGSKPLNATFTCWALSYKDSKIVSYLWDFGDGTPEQKTTTNTVTHTYIKAGVYKATVTIFDDKGRSAKSDPVIISVALWRFKTGDWIYSSPAIGKDGTIYVGSVDTYLYAINPDGTLKWKFKTEDWINSSPTIGKDGTIYVGSVDTYLYAINPDGTLKWKFKTEDSIDSTPAIGKDGTIYFGSEDGYLYAINPDGTLKWRFAIEFYIVSSPAIGKDGTIYFGSSDLPYQYGRSRFIERDGPYIWSHLYAINPDGTLKWEIKTEGDVDCSPAIGEDGTIYIESWNVGLKHAYLYAINPDGTLKWRFYKGGDVYSSPVIGEDGTIYDGSEDGYLYAINPDGTLKWESDSGGGDYPVIGEDGTIYVGLDYLYAINPDGTLKWKFNTGERPAIGEDGTIYVGSEDGYLYAIPSDSRGLAKSPWPMFHHDVKHTGRAVDVRHSQITIKKVTMDIDGVPINMDNPVFLNGVDLNVRFTPQIDWGGTEPDVIRYVTPNGTYEEAGAITLNVGTEFGVGGKLRVIAVNKSGAKSAPYETSFEVAPCPLGCASFVYNGDVTDPGYCLVESALIYLIKENFGSSIIPSTVPIFGGREVSMFLPAYLDVELDLNGKGRFFLGLQEGKGTHVSFAGARVPLVEKRRGRRQKLAKKYQFTVEIDAGLSFSYDRTGKKWDYGGTLGVGLEGYAQTAPYFIIVYGIPLYARLGAKLDIYNRLDLLSLSFENDQGLSLVEPTLDGTFMLNPYGKVMFGVGAADVVALEGYGKGGLNLVLEYPDGPPLKNLCVQLDAGVIVVLLVYQQTFDLWHYNSCLYDTQRSFQNLFVGVPTSELTPIPRKYLNKAPYARFNKQNPLGRFEEITSSYAPQEDLLQENIYPYSQPVIVSRNNNTYIFWLYDDPQRSSLNRTKLVYSKLKNGEWTVPKAVLDDGTADFHPTAGILPDGRVMVVWENVKEPLPDSATLDDMSSKLEISYALYNPTSGNWNSGTLTNNGCLDRSPKLAISQDGTAVVIWVKNRDNQLLGDSNDLVYAFWDKISWSPNQVIAADVGPVIKTSIGYNGTEGVLIWESDEDHDISTLTDRELRLARFTKQKGWQYNGLFTQDEVADLNPQVVYKDTGSSYLVWLKDNNIVMVKDLNPSTQTVAVRDMKSAGGMCFKALNRSKGLTLVWSDSSEEGADIYASYWDENYGKWGNPEQLTNDDSLERSIDGCYIDGHILALVYDKTKIKYTEDGLPQPEKTDIYTLSYREKTDILLNDLYLSESTVHLGEDVHLTGTITAEVVNSGQSIEHDIPVEFYAGDPQDGGELIGTAYIDGLLAPQESRKVSVDWIATKTPSTIYAIVDPNHQITDDINWQNNTMHISIGRAAMPAPAGPNITQLTGSNRANARVILGDVVTGGNKMELSVNFPAYAEPVDEYVAVYIPGLGVYFANESGVLTDKIVPFRTNQTRAVQKTIIDEFEVCPSLKSLEGTWSAYTLVTPQYTEVTRLNWAKGCYDLEWFQFDVNCGVLSASMSK